MRLEAPKKSEKPVSMYKFLNIKLSKKLDEIAHDEHKHKIVQGVRQSGKTKLLESIAIAEVHKPQKTIAIISANAKSAAEIMAPIREKCCSKGYLKPIVNNNHMLQLSNKSRILSFGVSENILRGTRVDVLLVDEMAFHNEKTLKTFWHANYPILHDGEIIVVSTRASRSKKKNFFWRLWVDAGEGMNTFKQFAISAKDVPYFTKEKLRQTRKALGRRNYEKEYTLRQK
jgi:hypothetical protein